MKVFNLNNENKNEVNELVGGMQALIRYHSNNCGHCVAMTNDWKALEDTLKNRNNDNVVVVSIEGNNIEHFDHFKDVQGYPTIMQLIHGKKHKEYTGDRSFNDILKFVNDNFNQFSIQKGGKKKFAKKGKKKLTKRHKKKSRKSRKQRRKSRK
jgi:hypothetical protein